MAMEEEITALLAGELNGRWHWVRAPQNVKATTGPYGVMQVISGPKEYTLRGNVRLTGYRVQFDTYAATFTAVIAADAALVAALSGIRSGGIQGVLFQDERDLPVTDAGDVNHLFRRSRDATIHHQET